MTDPGEDICDAIVAYVKGLSPTTKPSVSLVGQVEKTENPKAELLLEHQQLQVLFYPASETAERIGRGGESIERFVTAMVVIRKLDATFTKAKLAQYVREIKSAVRQSGKLAGAVCVGDATPVKVDSDQIKELGQFCAVSEFIHTKAGKDCLY